MREWRYYLGSGTPASWTSRSLSRQAVLQRDLEAASAVIETSTANLQPVPKRLDTAAALNRMVRQFSWWVNSVPARLPAS